jgi:hypothetical protein
MPRPSPVRIALAVSFLASSTLAFAQSSAVSSHWSCSLNGKDVDIRLAGDSATVAVNGEKRVLKRVEAQSESVYFDGTVGLRFKGEYPAPSNSPRWIENSKPSQLTKCTELDS